MGERLFDRYTIFHIGGGMLAKTLGLSLPMTILVSTIFEYGEHKMKESRPEIFPDPTPDSIFNVLGDTLAVIVGWVVKQ